ncbi:MAG TPA: anthranilate phosphoribosyltransferase [Burkholderiales bacterium]|nr:anthranilate phosphoribosyltransferase [Burkholderiales bacterium]
MQANEDRFRWFGAIVGRLIRGENITRDEARECWRQICEEQQPETHQGAFIAALRAKGETLEEVAGTFEALYAYDTIKVSVLAPEPLIDNCGTGGDTLKTLNISTGAAILSAACGLTVVRHASRAVSSHCGAIDVIEALGVNVESAPELPKQSIERAGIGAWNGFSSAVHPRMLGRVGSQIRFSSTINLVGPLLNPTMPSHKVMGVATPAALDLEPRILKELGFKRAFVMHGTDEATGKAMDELSTLGPSHVSELLPDGTIERYTIAPEDLNLPRGNLRELASSGDLEQDALALLRVIAGKDDGPRSDIVCLNAAPLLFITGKATGLREAIDMAREAAANGSALKKLRAWVSWQNGRPEDGLPTLEKMLKRL